MKCNRLEKDDDRLADLGEPMDPHVQECPDCRARHASYGNLAAMLAMDSPRPLPPSWREATLARIGARDRARRRRRRIAGTISIAGTALAAVLYWCHGQDEKPMRQETKMVVKIDHPAREAWRGGSPVEAHAGDTLRAEVPGGAAERYELRIYRAERELLARCPGDPTPACEQSDRALAVVGTMSSRGKYQVVWLSSSSPLPAPSGDYEADLTAADAAGARIVDVQRFHAD
jgi:hypothetical protein